MRSRKRGQSSMGDEATTLSRSSKNDKLRLGELLQRKGLITGADLRRAVATQMVLGKPIGEILLSMGAISADDLRRVLAEELRVPAVDLTKTIGDPFVLDLISKERAFELRAIPLFLVENQLTVAMPDPNNLRKLDELAFLTGKEILPVLALESDVGARLIEYHGELDPDSEHPAISFQTPSGVSATSGSETPQGQEDRPIVRLVSLILTKAIQQEASDIHLEPQDSSMVVRFRIDGRLQRRDFQIPPSAMTSVASRIKVLGQCDISERRVPQDGKVRMMYRNRRVDVRVSTYPTIYGEKIVLRLLDKERQQYDLANIGMSDTILARWQELLRRREGILLVTGPTGSGKSSTLYATLRHLNRPEVNIVTLEDPVEYELAGISQGQVNDRAGFSFAAGLRAILRQDPDIILVGEIRDVETAQIAVQAALTGHLVLATLHTNDAPSAVTRLVDIGVPRYLVSGALVGVLAQRLVRRVCPHCVADVELDDGEQELFGKWTAQGVPFAEGCGCKHCSETGYRGRVGVHELLMVDREIQHMISAGGDDKALLDAATGHGYSKLWWDGITKVRAGITTLRELARAVTPDQTEKPLDGPPRKVELK
jgi:type IV pilus assembly protein PilB